MNRSRRRLLRRLGGLCTVGAAAGIAGCSSDDGDGATPDGDDLPTAVTVDMTDDLKFVPETVEIAVDGTVTWENVGVVAHSVTAYADRIPAEADYFASGGFDDEAEANRAYPEEGSIGREESYAYTFETSGTYEYYCIPHESGNMVGTVVVE
ncbi:plastocyanin/azurin family copper-binding protein [Natronomonas gomsonensis]|uniref:plastocyanin/azurin family copper-binding protein n=1 Tax=Natronomonas gomsonensis TaxID=1046043 RepID=UPI0015B97C30|nr:plastocyanin/azurin family copper-binding protein [Natronomonas gomsonensis]